MNKKNTLLFNLPYSTSNSSVQLNEIYNHAKLGKSGYVCVSNVHMLTETYKDLNFFNVLNEASFIVPDGMPLVWLLKLKGFKDVERMAGYDVAQELMKKSSKDELPILFIGSTTKVLKGIEEQLKLTHPNLNVVDYISLPFRELSESENNELISRINNLGPKIIFVAFGCPKQEIWMNKNKNNIDGLMVGIGGAFPLLAGHQKRASSWIRNMGLEWMFRLILEPRRLWKRYLVTNTHFFTILIKKIIKREKI